MKTNQYLVMPEQVLVSHQQERRKDIIYLTTHSTHFIYGHLASNMWTTQIARGNPLQSQYGILFSISSKVSFICIIPDRNGK